MGQIYHALGLRVTCLIHEGALIYDPEYKTGSMKQEAGIRDEVRDVLGSFQVEQSYLRPISRREAYLADITYGTNHEFGFDYLRDNLAYDADRQVQNGRLHFAIIDEVDSILIDEARTPLIISAPDTASSDYYKVFARVVATLQKNADYTVDEKQRSVSITDEGIGKVEKAVNIQNLYAAENLRLTHYLQESLRAKALYLKDRDYVVKDNQIILVDQFTGRLMLGRRFSGGLHQAIEAKEGVTVQHESRTYAQISIQNYFRLYKKLAGMTGTAQTSAEEFDKVYGLEVVSIPTHQEMIRRDEPDLVFKTAEAKYRAIVKEVKERQQRGQPVLIGTVSIEKNEYLSNLLKRAGVVHELLNAKNNEREGAIIAQAGRLGAVTVATNMAGRGVDIILGGNPPKSEEKERVREAGGLHVIGTERHDSRRIDNQLRGRAGRQGDIGSSQFYLSLEDDLMRVFGGGRIQSLMDRLDFPEDEPIQSGLLSRAINQAQSKVEGFNFDARKHLLDYDDVLNKQRLSIYAKRQEILEKHEARIRNQESETEMESHHSKFKIPDSALPIVLGMLDMLWMTHLENMEEIADAVRLRAYGQHDPLSEYRREGKILFNHLLSDFDAWLKENVKKFKNELGKRPEPHNSKFIIPNSNAGRNDPCPCGSGKKYKQCCRWRA
jgi:preprotein translocase subunit SecA